MRINNIHSNTALNPVPAFRFNEGALTCTVQKIGDLVAGILIVLSTYFLVSPIAAVVSAAGGLLAFMIFDANQEDTASDQRAWINSMAQEAGSIFRNSFVNAIPVSNPGERVVPGEGHFIRPGYPPQDNRFLAIHPDRAHVGQGALGHAAINLPPERPPVHPQNPQNARRAPVNNRA